MTASHGRKWPESLGSFDEESCRFFLHDVGNQIVPCYPFPLGIEEVYALIIEKYGPEGASDATSVLQELLEDKHNACGIGDDGDIWRSWRHHWRHRNDDECHPFVPKTGNVVLFPATSPCIRRLKAENFIRQQLVSLDDCASFLQPPGSYSGDKKESPDIGTVSYIKDHDTSSAALLSLELLEALEETQHRHDKPKSEPTNALLSEERTASANSLVDFPIPPHTPPALSKAWTVSVEEQECQIPTRGKSCSRAEEQAVSKVSKSEPYLCIRGRCSSDNNGCLAITHEAVAEETVESDNNHNTSERSTAFTNRQARLIDGTIFTSRNRKEKGSVDSQNTSGIQRAFPHFVAKKLSGCTANPGRSIRDSWSRGLRQLLLVERFDWLNTRQNSRRGTFTQSNNASSVPAMLSESKEVHIVESPNRVINFGFDGAVDSIIGSSASSINLNKPLPPNPENSPQARKRGKSDPAFTQNGQAQSTTTSPSLSKCVGSQPKIDAQSLTRSILQSTATGSHELPAIHEIDGLSDPGLCSTETLNSPISWRSWYQRTPTSEKHVSMSPAQPPPPLNFNKLRDCVLHERPGKDFSTVSSTSCTQSPPYGHSLVPKSTTVGNMHPMAGSPCNPPVRGRTSEVKPTRSQSTKGDQLAEAAETPSKRSRSPIKRLLALGKSGTQHDDKKPQTPPRPKTPASEKKSSIKRWGEKIRYGFLNPEEEQLLREDLIEKHIDSSGPSPPNSSIPISLEPPSQAKLHCEVELYLLVTANNFLMKEARAGRLSTESVEKVRSRWEKMGRPQVLEFHYDQATQHRLVSANTRTVKFCGDAAKDVVQITAILNGWMVLGREMSVRTLSNPDSMIRKHLHDAHRLLELLGAPLVTCLAFESMQVKVLQMINQRQKERIDRKRNNIHTRSFSDGTRVPSGSSSIYERDYTAESFQLDKIRLSPTPMPTIRRESRRATGAKGAIMSLPTPLTRTRERATPEFPFRPDQAKGGTIHKPVQEKPENFLL